VLAASPGRLPLKLGVHNRQAKAGRELSYAREYRVFSSAERMGAMKLKTNSRRNVTGRSLLVKAILIACLLALSLPSVAQAQGFPSPWPPYPVCQEDWLGDQLILICIPPGIPGGDPLANWNGVLVVYAHGYVAPQAPLALPVGELGRYPQLINVLLGNGYAFATTSYSKNGYAVEQAGKDVNALVRHFKTHVLPNAGLLDKVFVVGASEGALITTMLVEKHPGVYDGGLAMCGPLGGMPAQVQYLADFRAVFDYFFPAVFPSFGVTDVPSDAYLQWDTFYVPTIFAEMSADPIAAAQLFSVTQASDPVDPGTYFPTTLGVLFYSIWGTNDLIATAGGMPYHNQDTWYIGSFDDGALNLGVERVESDGRARAYVRRAYQPTGELYVRLVTLHNILDPVVPFWHEGLYAGAGSPWFVSIPVAGYGHCQFTAEEVLAAFGILVEP
jgi:pimeloyl-ACP methyl ester carboxylesterase